MSKFIHAYNRMLRRARDGWMQKAYHLKDIVAAKEKRMAELEQKLEQTEKDLTNYQFNYPKIKDLEIKRKAERQIFQGIVEKKNEQLTKAKELLKRSYKNYIYLEPLRSEIEHFLKEIDK